MNQGVTIGIRKRPPRELFLAIAHDECDMAGVSFHDLMSDARWPNVVWVRAMICRRLVYFGCFSLSGIGYWLRLHHTTVLYHTKRDWPLTCPKLRAAGARPPKRKRPLTNVPPAAAAVEIAAHPGTLLAPFIRPLTPREMMGRRAP